jgi:hypothetical protein
MVNGALAGGCAMMAHVSQSGNTRRSRLIAMGNSPAVSPTLHES